MMRGNRQGNNAFLEEPEVEHKTLADFANDEFFLHRILVGKDIEKKTF
jgi:hypothetical protein